MYNQVYYRKEFDPYSLNQRFADPPASSDPLVISQRKARNSKKRVNGLPPELLTYIFRIAEEEERATRKRRVWYLTFPDRATRVCTHWRNVAIGSPTLWTYIHITRPPPHHLAVLYLARAGSTAPLDIDIEMRSRFWDKAKISAKDWEGQLNATNNLLTFFISQGATAPRWKSVALRAKEPEVIFKLIGFLNMYSAPALQGFYLNTESYSRTSKGRSLAQWHPGRFTDAHARSGLAVPNMCSAELIGVSWKFVFDRPSPLFTKLTRLSLEGCGYRPQVSELRELLSANPLLESLSLKFGFMTERNWWDPIPTSGSKPILLSSLRTLSIEDNHPILEPLWVIDAPALEKFSLFVTSSTEFHGTSLSRGLEYISTGKLPSHNTSSDDTDSGTNPIFPFLRELDVSRVYCKSAAEAMTKLLASFPFLTKLSISHFQAGLLEQMPTALPNLVHLKLGGHGSCPQIEELLRIRSEAGFPIQMVEIPKNKWGGGFKDELPRGVTLVENNDGLDPDYDAGSGYSSYGSYGSDSSDGSDNFDGFDSSDGSDDSD